MCLAGCLLAFPHCSSCPRGIESFTALNKKTRVYIESLYISAAHLLFCNISAYIFTQLHNISSSVHSDLGCVGHKHMIKLNECLSGMIWLTAHSCRGVHSDIDQLTLQFRWRWKGPAAQIPASLLIYNGFMAEMKCQEVLIALWWLE